MSIALAQPQISSTRGKPRLIIAAEAKEFIVFCPACGTLETVWLTQDGLLVPTRKFSQSGVCIYHDCGAVTPCQLY
jgi:phage terminase large subunit GpA-like protein